MKAESARFRGRALSRRPAAPTVSESPIRRAGRTPRIPEKTCFPNTELLIDGRWRPGATKRTLDVLNPATGEIIGTAAVADPADLDEALVAAGKGFKAWRAVSAFDRYKVLRKAADLLRGTPRKRPRRC